jgi:hypothetical protein
MAAAIPKLICPDLEVVVKREEVYSRAWRAAEKNLICAGLISDAVALKF